MRRERGKRWRRGRRGKKACSDRGHWPLTWCLLQRSLSLGTCLPPSSMAKFTWETRGKGGKDTPMDREGPVIVTGSI